MGAVGGYDFRLRCDGAECYARQQEAGAYPAEIHGATLDLTDESGSRCRSTARRFGWKFDMVEGWAFCPLCRDAPRKDPPR